MTQLENKRLAIMQIYSELNIPINKVTLKEGGPYDRFVVYPEAGTPIYLAKRPSKRIMSLLGEEGTRIYVDDDALVYETPSKTFSSRPSIETLTLKHGLGDAVHQVDVPIVLGCGVDGRAKIVDLSDAGGLLIEGENMNEVDVVIHNALHTLRDLRPGDIRYAIISDNTSLAVPKEEKYYDASCKTSNAREAAAVLYMAANEIERRKELLARAGLKDICSQRNRKDRRPWPYLVVIVDGLEILLRNKQYATKIVQSVIRLATQGHSTGVHIVASLSKPVAIQGLLTFNFSHRILLKLSHDKSEIMYGRDAHRLLETGDAFLCRGGDILERVALMAPLNTL